MVTISSVRVGNFIFKWGVETMAPSLLSFFLSIKEKYDVFASTSRYLMVRLLESLH